MSQSYDCHDAELEPMWPVRYNAVWFGAPPPFRAVFDFFLQARQRLHRIREMELQK
jgi:hypothetical protein